MKIIFQSFTKYNLEVNKDLLALLEPLGEERVFQKSKAYYPSIFDTMAHIFNTDIAWLRRYKDAFPESAALASSALVAKEKDELKNEMQKDFRLLFKYRKEMDEVIFHFIEEIDEEKFNTTVKFTNNRGEHVEKELWKLLMHWFNHQTHHRGQITVQLDMIDIFNDFSGMLAKI